jgi:hypothetical protein
MKNLVIGCLAGLMLVAGGIQDSCAGGIPQAVRYWNRPSGAPPVDTSHKMKIQFTGYNKTGVLTNFPVLVILTTNWTLTAASTNGWDFRFKSSNDTDYINYEFDTWSTNTNTYVWVQVTNFYSNCYIWAYWNDNSITTAPAAYTTNGATWSASYRGVWHMKESPTNLAWFADSASTNPGKYFDPGGTASVTTNGPVGKAVYFSGDNDYIKVTNKANFELGANATVAFWLMKWPASGDYPWVCKGDRNNEGWSVKRFWDGSWRVVWSGIDVNLNGSTRADYASWNTSWYYVATTLGGGKMKIYVNGLEDATTDTSGSLKSTSASFAIGARTKPDDGDNPMNWLTGALDEIQVSSVSRSSNWVWASYMTVGSNSIFTTYTQIQ